MSEFQLLQEKEHSFLVKHPKGHEFEVAKAGLDKKVLEKIKGMKPVKMADGGVVPDPLAPQSYTTPAPVVTSDNVGDGYYRKPDDLSSRSPASDPTSDASRAPASFLGDAAQSVKNFFSGPAGFQGSQNDKPIDVGAATKDFFSGPMGFQTANAATTHDASAPQDNSPVMTDAQKQAQLEREALSGNGPAPAGYPSNPSAGGMPGVDLPKDYKDAFAMQASGIKGAANATNTASQQMAQAQADAAQKQQAITDQYKSVYQKLDQDNDAFMKSYADGKIDPHRLWNDMSTGSKISAGIGMVLSGLGSGLTGQPNLAMQVLDKRIEQDIDAQKTNLDKNRGLYAMNMEKYKNSQAAETATRLQINSMLQSQIAQSAAKMQGAQAVSQSQMLLGGLKQQQAQLKQSLAAQMMNRMATNGPVQSGSSLDQYMNSTNETYRKNAVPIGNSSYQARTEDDAKELKKSEALYKPIEQEIQGLKAMGGSAITDPAKRAQAQASMARLAMMVNEFNGYSRFTDTDKDTIEKQFNNPTSIGSLFQGKGATADTLRALQNKLESERGKRLIGYRTYNSFKPAGQN